MSDEKKLEAWLRAEFAKPRDADHPLKKFVLRSAAPGGRGHDIQTFDVDPDIRIEVEEIPVWAGTIMTNAQDDADGSGPGVHRYVVYSYVKGEVKPVARFMMRVRGDSDNDFDDESGDEAPTSKGLLQQLMRHNEALTRLTVQSAASLTGVMARQLESANRLNEKLVEERRNSFLQLEAAKSEEHERSMQLMLTDNTEKRKDAAFQKLMGLVPLVLNKIVGAKVLPDKSDPLMMILEPLITSMSAEQFQAIQSTLSPDQTLMFVELLQAFQKKQSATKEN